jgi:hypothetical protein
MTNQPFNLPRALNAYPDHTTHILQETERIQQLREECGCSMGAKFMISSFAFLGIFFLFFAELTFPNVLIDIVFGLLFVFIASAVGKIIGIGLAKLRLAGLYRSLKASYPLGGE